MTGTGMTAKHDAVSQLLPALTTLANVVSALEPNAWRRIVYLGVSDTITAELLRLSGTARTSVHDGGHAIDSAILTVDGVRVECQCTSRPATETEMAAHREEEERRSAEKADGK